MSNANANEAKFRRNFGGFILAGVTSAFFVSPLLPLSYPITLFLGGGAAAWAVFVGYHIVVIRPDRALFNQLWIAILFSIGLLGWTLVDALRTANSLYSQCYDLQMQMERGTAEKVVGQADAKDRFTAYGCQWQILPPRVVLPSQS